jgi:hypothetical protein
MALPLDPSEGSLSLNDISTEFDGGDPPDRLSEYYAGGGLVPAGTTGTYGAIPSNGQISFKQFYGASSVPPTFNITISTNQTNLNLRTYALSNGWNGTQPAFITIGTGVYIISDTVNTPALTTGSFPNGLTIINNGFVVGLGGSGYRNTIGASTAGGNGSNAINLDSNVTIENNSYIAAGGGGGGGSVFGGVGGGGAGGGRGGSESSSSTGVAGGTPGNVGTNGTTTIDTGGAGGRILPGTGGAGGIGGNNIQSYPGSGGGAGGGGACAVAVGRISGTVGGQGGGGGGYGAAGGNGSYFGANAANNVRGGNGGSADAAGESVAGTTSGQTLGGTGGKAVNLNGFVVTWSNIGTRYGAIS